MKKKIKVLHVASFNGNIGDIANHNGFRTSIKNEEIICEYTNVEIRRYYKIGDKYFDKDFVKLANEHDLIVFGGGGFFELKWDYSKTGTTLDLSDEILDSIHPPILFNGIGVSIAKGVSESSKKKFQHFLEKITSDHHCFVTVRNDGSYELLHELYGEQFLDKILKVPDGGFFCEIDKEYEHNELKDDAINIGINIAGDMPDIRWNQNNSVSRQEFINGFARICNYILQENNDIRLIFVPHIYSDLKIIAEILEKIDDIFRRNRITCAPYCNGEETNGMSNFDIYRHCDLVLGMRYHANVVPIGMEIPTLLLGSYTSHIKLYNDLQIMDRSICVNERGFEGKLIEGINSILQNREFYVEENKRIMTRLKCENKEYMKKLLYWLEHYKEKKDSCF